MQINSFHYINHQRKLQYFYFFFFQFHTHTCFIEFILPAKIKNKKFFILIKLLKTLLLIFEIINKKLTLKRYAS